MKKQTLAASAALAGLLSLGFSGCGASDSSSNDTDSTTISGNVADGYLVGAKVCLDKNSNMKCDAGEYTTITGKHGTYKLSGVTKADADAYPILVEVDENTTDEDNNMSVGGSYTLMANPHETFVSPVSTMVRNYQEDNDVNETAAREAIMSQLGLKSLKELKENYIESKSPDAEAIHKKAKIIARLKMLVKNSVLSADANASHEIVERLVNKKIREKLADVKNEVDVNQADVDTNVGNVFSTINLSDVKNDIGVLKKVVEDHKVKKKLSESVLEKLLHSGAIKQDHKYSVTYNGGTDIRKITVEDSAGKNCYLQSLDTTSAFNQYGASYKIDNSEYSPTQAQLMSKDANGDTNFLLTWMYYTAENSHLDFYVHCRDN